MKGAKEVIKRWCRKEYSTEKKNMMKGKEKTHDDERRNSKNKIHKVKDTQTKGEKKGDN